MRESGTSCSTYTDVCPKCDLTSPCCTPPGSAFTVTGVGKAGFSHKTGVGISIAGGRTADAMTEDLGSGSSESAISVVDDGSTTTGTNGVLSSGPTSTDSSRMVICSCLPSLSALDSSRFEFPKTSVKAEAEEAGGKDVVELEAWGEWKKPLDVEDERDLDLLVTCRWSCER